MDRALADAAGLISQILADTIEKFLANELVIYQEPPARQPMSAEPTLSEKAPGPAEVASSVDQSEPAATESERALPGEPLEPEQSEQDGVGFMAAIPSADSDFIAAIPSADSEMATNLVDRVLRDAVCDVAEEELQQRLTHPTGAEASLHDFKPLQPYFGDLPLPITRHIVSDSLSIISIKHDADLDHAADYPSMRNSFTSLTHPDVSRIQRLMVSSMLELFLSFLLGAYPRQDVAAQMYLQNRCLS